MSFGVSFFKVDTFKISGSQLCKLALTILFAAIICHFLPDNRAIFAAGKVIFAALALGMTPGIFALLTFKPMPQTSVLEALGISLAISLGLVEFWTIFSLLLHVPAITTSTLYMSLLLMWGVALLFVESESNRSFALTVGYDDLAACALILFMAALLYVKGSPFFADEEQVHISTVRRLALHPHPSIDNFYMIPDYIFTHPFPGVNYFMALVSRVGEIDPLFAYHKLRFFWVLVSFTVLYSAARLVFESRPIALISLLTGVLFALNGVFADVGAGVSMGHLLTFSHPSDVVMEIYLPALILLTFYYLKATTQRENRFFFGVTMLLSVVVVIIHIREAIQYLVYLGCFFIGLVIFLRDKTLLKKTILIAILTIIAMGIYTSYHQSIVQEVAELDSEYKAWMLDIVGNFSFLDFFRLHSVFTYFDLNYRGITPFVLLLSPMVLLAFRDKTLMLFVGMSILGYTLILRFPFFYVPYIYFTYYEILLTPVRNVIFFVCLLAGPVFYWLALNIARIRPMALGLLCALLCGLLIGRFSQVGHDFFLEESSLFGILHSDFVFMTVILGYLAVMVFLYKHPYTWGLPDHTHALGSIGLVLLIVPVLIMTAKPQNSPLEPRSVKLLFPPFPPHAPLFWKPEDISNKLSCVNATAPVVRYTDTYANPPSHLAFLFPPKMSCPMPPDLIDFFQNKVSVEAHVAVSAFEYYVPTIFIIQQIMALPPAFNNSVSSPQKLSPNYYRYLVDSLISWRDQPLYNAKETTYQKLAFLKAVGYTHVLVGPQDYDNMSAMLGAEPTFFEPIYDHNRWAVYEIHYPEPGSEAYTAMNIVVDAVEFSKYPGIPLADQEEFEQHLTSFKLIDLDKIIFNPSSQIESVASIAFTWGNQLAQNTLTDKTSLFDLAAIVIDSKFEDSLDLEREEKSAIEKWRNTKLPGYLQDAHIDYLFFTTSWYSLLSNEEAATLENPNNYELIRKWDFPEQSFSVWLYRVVGDSK